MQERLDPSLSLYRLLEEQTLRASCVALAPPGRMPLPYRELLTLVEGCAATLAGQGVGRNDRVAVVLPNGPEMAAAFLGVASCVACAPLNPAYRAAEYDF